MDVLAVILGGGAGSRLFPLTKDRAKPAVPLAGKYRLVDIPISNCINSNLKRIFLLTQFNSSSLHRHIHQSYRFDEFSSGFVELMAAQQTPKSTQWYQGTADAVRQNLDHFNNHRHELVLILSGDQLYSMDFKAVIAAHLRSRADVTVATIPVPASSASSFGIMEIDSDRRIVRFVEKPKDPAVLEGLKVSSGIRSELNAKEGGDLYLASMGIYVFNRRVLAEALAGSSTDFGKHIIPELIGTRRVFSYIYQGYWEDIGTIQAFYEANLDLCEPLPKFNFFDNDAPIYSHARYLPASKIVSSRIEKTAMSEGCIIIDAAISRSLIGLRSRIQEGAVIEDSILMGQDYYETEEQAAEAAAAGLPRIGIGRNARIERTIVDKNARIGDNVRISPKGKPAEFDGEGFFIRGGIVVIPKGGVIPSGTVI
jgi:glucose-1-phosphate adenylyltransferase